MRYFERRKDIVKIFNDLDKLLNFCRLELLPYNPADLYNKSSPIWLKFEAAERHQRWIDRGRPESKSKNKNPVRR